MTLKEILNRAGQMSYRPDPQASAGLPLLEACDLIREAYEAGKRDGYHQGSCDATSGYDDD